MRFPISMTVRPFRCALAAVACAASLASHAAPEGRPATSPLQTTVVMVHGDFADGSGWSPVIKLLQAAGVNAVAVQNPLSSLEDDAEATRRVIDRQPGRVVLVGHSWGGFVITQAGVDPKVESLVYVAGFAPAQGESVLSLTQNYPEPWPTHLVFDDAGDFTLDESGYLTYFAPDVPRRDAKALYATQGAGAYASLSEPATAVAWLAKPSRYVLATDDQMIDPALQDFMSQRMGARVTRVDSSHVAMLSHPEVVARVILDAVLHR
jgi:pimeloyl-ACP methyl ester carboxylesterase